GARGRRGAGLAGCGVPGTSVAEAAAGRPGALPAGTRRAASTRPEVAVAAPAWTPLAAISASFVGHSRTLAATHAVDQRRRGNDGGVRRQRLTDGPTHGTVLSA